MFKSRHATGPSIFLFCVGSWLRIMFDISSRVLSRLAKEARQLGLTT